MRVCLRHKAFALVGVLLLAGCSTSAPQASETTTAESQAPSAAGLDEVTVQVPGDLAAEPFDEPRKALVPKGWTMSVWARVPKPRLAVWAPDGALLVSLPSAGQVIRIEPSGLGPQMQLLVNGMNQPHGLAFQGSTLFIAESDQVDAFAYAGGKATPERTVAADLPDARSPDLRGAYSHALKSVAVGPDGAVWTAVNNRDNVEVPDQGPSYGQVVGDYVDENPPESLAKLTPGRELGWPYCNPDGGPANLPLIRDVQTNADGSKLDCATLPPIEQSMGAHSAPLGMAFVDGALPAPYDKGALVGVHGSWNRQPPRAPEVSFFPWQNGNLGNQQTLVGGFQAADGTRWGRPVAAVVGPDGAVYVTDDAADAIYRVAPPGR